MLTFDPNVEATSLPSAIMYRDILQLKTLDFVIFAFTVLAGLLVLLLYLWVNGFFKRTADSAPTDSTIPRWTTPPADKELGDLGELAKHGSLHQYLLHLHDKGKVPMTSFWWGKTHVVSVCSPQSFKETVRLVNRPVELYIPFKPLLGAASVQYANDEEWEMRQKCLYHTLKGEELREYFSIFVKIAQEAESHWSSFSSDQRVSLMKEAFPMAIKGIARTCLGDVFENDAQLDELTTAYHKCWREMEVRIGDGPPDSEREAEFQRNKQVIVDIIKRIIHSRREGAGQREIPFIDSMLQKYDSEDKIVSDTITFMVGGFHTSGYLLTWMLWYLAENPASQDRLRAEIDSEVKGQCGEKLKEYAGRNNTFMRQVMDETLRLSTLAPYAARYSDKDMVVCGHSIKAGTPIIHALGVGSKNQTTWKDNIESWDPDRFQPDGKRGLEFCPFGVPSRRKCPGYLFSYFEVGVFASILLGRFIVEPVEGQKVIQVHGLVTEPKEEIFVYVRQREGE